MMRSSTHLGAIATGEPGCGGIEGLRGYACIQAEDAERYATLERHAEQWRAESKAMKQFRCESPIRRKHRRAAP